MSFGDVNTWMDRDALRVGAAASFLPGLVADAMEAWLPGDPRGERVRQVARALARGSAAIDLRLARLCCSIQQLDLRPLGYSSFTAFLREELCWNPSWQRRLARLLRSDLELIKAAVVAGVLPLTRAVDAPGRVAVDDQRQFIEAAVSGARGEPPGGSGSPRQVLTGDDAVAVRQGRRLVRLLVGQRLPDRVADRQMLSWHARGEVPRHLLDPTRAPPPPDLSEARWPDDAEDPATLLFGPWTEPRGLADALRRARGLMAARRKRRAALARLLEEVRRCWRFLGWGFSTFDDWVRHDLDMSVRTAYRIRAEGRAIDRFPDLSSAVDRGLPPERALALARLADTSEELRRWLSLAEHLPAIELQRAGADRGRRDRRRRYEALLLDAPGLVQRAMARRQERLDAAALTETGDGGPGLAGWVAGSRPLGPRPDPNDPLAGIAVALDEPEPVGDARSGRVVTVEPGVLVAARWLLATVRLPPARGTGRIRRRADFTCANPECRRRTLRVHVHHLVPRSLGGTDDDDNLRCLCPSCHLRLVHGGFMAIEHVDDADVFLYPGRAVVVRRADPAAPARPLSRGRIPRRRDR
ncbi:MAG: HNH endonuclease [Deltaproteobacteria bacterium]|nr:MAG: HNH endonuclease [Deltaproteobacteria bacterium]